MTNARKKIGEHGAESSSVLLSLRLNVESLWRPKERIHKDTAFRFRADNPPEDPYSPAASAYATASCAATRALL